MKRRKIERKEDEKEAETPQNLRTHTRGSRKQMGEEGGVIDVGKNKRRREQTKNDVGY